MTDRPEELLDEALSPDTRPLPRALHASLATCARLAGAEAAKAAARFPLAAIVATAALLALVIVLAGRLPAGPAAAVAGLALACNVLAILTGAVAIVAGRLMRHG